ncbi:DUF4136 domain-containing protein [Rufibacter sediminis]|uniref:DUF4136 domain-containing protein n=1 Tax=Rufibacter sediminis TaxID=2762756 RepID=A0ABR6VS05_9BACT|nr:DUF4136 domain-containing protein [Rufibacter sediminis]MBC3539715.1 DUF4136 domain-containing protein [Rufibacter sediminis]
MKYINHLTCIAVLVFLLSACSSIRVLNTEAAPDFNLSTYKTFDFAQGNTGADSTETIIPAEHIAALQREVSQQLEKRGLTRSTTNPDLLVNLGIVVQEKTQTRDTNFRTDAPYYTGQRRYSWKSKEVEVGRYKEGTISLHLVNNAQNTLVWSAEAEAVVPKKTTEVQARISEGVEKLFESITPASGQ